MNDNLEHLLSKHGILTSFSIAKKINENNIKELSDKIKNNCKSKSDFNQKLKNEITKQSSEDIIKGKVPGLIKTEQNSPDTNPEKSNSKKLQYNPGKIKLALLYTIISKINTEILNNKLTKNDVCFMIYAILNFLEITEEDFKKFHISAGDDSDSQNDDLDDDDDVDEDGNPNF